jgi:glucan 1,3-beta-glucosidase
MVSTPLLFWPISVTDFLDALVIDHYEYQVFTHDLVALQPCAHRQLLCIHAKSWSGTDKWEVIGE